MTTVYLSSACKNVSEAESKEWRQYVRDRCSFVSNIKVFDPIRHFSYREHDPGNSKLVMDYFLQMVKRADVILVNLNYSARSVGTGMEVQKAVDEGKFIIGFGNVEVYDYIEDCCSAVFKDIDTAIDFIFAHYIL